MRERLQNLLRLLVASIRQRNAREQALLAGAAFAFVLVLIQFAVVNPLRGLLAESRAQAERASRDLQQVVVLAPELLRLRTQLGAVEQRIQPGDQTNLLQLLGQLAQDANVKVESIRQKVGSRNERYPETRAEVELRGATLAQTVQFLYKIETAPLYLIVRSLSIRASGGTEQLLDVTFSVSSFQRA
jgi:hypothetical protein